MSRHPAGTAAKFLQEALASNTTECIYWPHHKRKGYASMRLGGKTVNVNHIVCDLLNGPRPTPKHETAHNCGKGHLACINPKHVRWATHAENCADKAGHGTAQIGAKNPAAVLTEDEAIKIMELKGTAPAREIAALFEVSRETVSHIHNGRKWAHLFTEDTSDPQNLQTQ